MNNVIEFKNIKKAYEDKVVISDFNLSIEKGEFVTIIGSSGCGKTTILKMINGLIEPTSGDIFIDGEKIKILLNFVVTLVMRFKEVCYFPI